MKPTVNAVIACLLAIVPTSSVCSAPWDKVVFQDDFSLTSPDGGPDPQKWVINVPEEWWWVQGRTFYPSSVYHPAGPFPKVDNGICTLEHHSYNPYDLAQEHWTLLGGQIRTVEEFGTAGAYRFEAILRCGEYPSGLVTSFFTYGFDGLNSDEIDFEFVSKKNNEDPRSDGDWVLTNTWNESMQKPSWVWVPGLDLTQWNCFRIYWHVGQRVDWTWLANPEDETSEVLLRTETDSFHIPDQPMGLYSNSWAAVSGWPEAYSSDLQPVSVPQLDQVLNFGLDDVNVSVPEPTSAALVAIGLFAISCRRRHSRSTSGSGTRQGGRSEG